MRMTHRSAWVLTVMGFGTSAIQAWAQPTFSIDFQGPPVGLPDSFPPAIPLTEADLLVTAPAGMPAPGPLVLPGTVAHGGPPPIPHLGLPLYGGVVGHLPGVPGMVEVDAVSYGMDYLLRPPVFAGVWTFSVDEFATGLPPLVAFPPNLGTEGAVGALEASADVFSSFPPGAFPLGPVPPGAVPPPGNAVLFDGNGLAPPAATLLPGVFGLGLVEPNPPIPGIPAGGDVGTNLDALDVDLGGPFAAPFPVYFSLDSMFVDPIEGFPANSGSAAANGPFVGGDVLFKVMPGPGAAAVYAPAGLLGLDLFGPDTDDLDALVLLENGIAGYQPAPGLFAWGPGGGDMLLFSVRRGSAVVGLLDSLFGIPIEEGDILVPPFPPAIVPGIFVAAENLGLATLRSLAPAADDLDGLDVSPDCNGNSVPDFTDIQFGVSADCNGNGIPDDCELLCGDGVCCPGEDPCTCPVDCGPFPPNESPGLNCTDGLDNDCDLRTDCADPDCAGDPACVCGNGSCDPGETSCTCPLDCGLPPTNETPLFDCNDGLDNDCDGSKDCIDPDCATDPGCLCGNGVCDPGETSCNCPADCGPPALLEFPNVTCADGLDNDCDGAADCLDLNCATDPTCTCGNGVCGFGENSCNCPVDCGPPMIMETPGFICNDTLDNDCDGLTDCADSDCPQPEMPGVNCADGFDNDCDTRIDCLDPDCVTDPNCLCGNGFCDPGETPCNCAGDCGPPPLFETPGVDCADGVDNDCDTLIDCMDPDCAVDPACLCGNGICDSGETPCTCPADCGLPPLVETPGLTCFDGLDNDCDGPRDCADPDCAGDPVCLCGNGVCAGPEDPCNCPADCGPPVPEGPGLCGDGMDNDCDGFTDCADLGCAGDPVCLCGDGTCGAPENPCNCPIDCGVPMVEGPGLCADGIDNDCNGTTDCADPGCAGDPLCLCGNGMCVPPESSCTCPIDCGLPFPMETPGVNCTDGLDNDCDGPRDCADSDCASDPVCLCGNGMCVPPENQCNCPADCGVPPPAETPGVNCGDGLDNDCDLLTDCDDPHCASDPFCPCVCEGDVDFDGDTDECDLLIVGNCASCENNPLPPSCGNPATTDCDVNCDGAVDLLDFGDEQCLQYLTPAECCDPPHGACSNTSLFQGCLEVPGPFCVLIGGDYAGDGTDCPPGTGDCNGNGIGDGCEPQQCMSDSECDDMDVCTCDFCVCGVCVHQPRESGDVNCDCFATDVDDIICVLDCFITSTAVCPTADIFPPCTGDGMCDVDDILEVLRVFEGESSCVQCTVPCPFGACCDGSDCRVTTPVSCLSAGDAYQGDGTACPPLAPDPCP